jgi:signal transduction histidine kinase
MPYKLSSLFGSLSEPVVAARGGDIIYRNPAARQTPAIARRGLADLIPEYALRDPPETFLTEALLDGSQYTVSGTMLDGVVVYTFAPENPPDISDASDVIASVAASLREPLALLKLASDRMLEREEDTEPGMPPEYAVAMRRGIFGISRALNHLNAFVFLAEGGSALPERTHFDLARECRDLTHTVVRALDLSEDRLTFISSPRRAPFYGDRRLIDRMLLCLIGNAFLFTPEGTSVCIALSRAGGKFLISVTDDGGGLSDGARRDVWARYGAGPGRYVAGGAGLGLSVVQSIARMHGGGALLESRPGIGTSVIVYLPAHESRTDPRVPSDTDASYYVPAGSMEEILTELAELVPPEKFSLRYLD